MSLCLNAPGNGIADDKGIYYFVPEMIRYYLGEEPILHNAPTYLPFYEKDREYVLEYFDDLVIKDVAEAGGYGVVFGNKLSEKEKEMLKEKICTESRRFIAQEVINFQDMKVTGRRFDCGTESRSQGICSFGQRDKGMEKRIDTVYEKSEFLCCKFISGRRI